MVGRWRMLNIYETYQQILNNPEFAKVFDNFSDEQKTIMQEHVKNFLLELDKKISNIPTSNK